MQTTLFVKTQKKTLLFGLAFLIMLWSVGGGFFIDRALADEGANDQVPVSAVNDTATDGTVEPHSVEAEGLAPASLDAAIADIWVSDYTELYNAITGTPSGASRIIGLQNSFSLTALITISQNKNITLVSPEGEAFTLTQSASGVRHFSVAAGASFTLGNVVLDGGTGGGTGGTGPGTSKGGVANSGSLYLENGAVVKNCYFSSSGGGVLLSAGTFTMNGGSIIENRAFSGGGGVHMNSSNATFVMNGGSITGNTANGGTNAGAGVFVRGAFYMNGGEITNNVATSTTAGGAGVLVYEGSNFIMGNGTGNPLISGNESYGNGGGVYVVQGSCILNNGQIRGNTALGNGGGVSLSSANVTSFIMTGGSVVGNTASGSSSTSGGGGIYFPAVSSGITTLTISGASSITDNAAPSGYGGGIYCTENYRSQMVIGQSTVFSGNTASTLAAPPLTAATDYPSIRFTSISIPSLVPYHPLNNYDISYRGSAPFSLTYYGNGNDSGNPPTSLLCAAGATVVVADQATLSKSGYTFFGWNSTADGSGASYGPGEDLIMPAQNTSLYAEWTQNAIVSIEYYFDGVHDPAYNRTIFPQPLATVSRSDVELLAPRPGYVFFSTVPVMPQSALSLDGTTVEVNYVTEIEPIADPVDPANPSKLLATGDSVVGGYCMVVVLLSVIAVGGLLVIRRKTRDYRK